MVTEREPLEDRRVTHTVCLEHRTELLGQLARMARPRETLQAPLITPPRE